MEKKMGWIKLHRSITDWEWYQDANAVRVFLHLLVCANRTDKKWRGVNVAKGQVLATRGHLSSALGIGEQSVRTALKKLERSETIKVSSNKIGTVVTVLNWKEYQGKDNCPADPANKGGSGNGPKTNQQTNQRSTNKLTNEGDCESDCSKKTCNGKTEEKPFELTNDFGESQPANQPDTNQQLAINKKEEEGKKEEQDGEASPAKPKSDSSKGRRIPDGFPDKEAMAYAFTKADKDKAELEAEKFRDHWLSTSGAKGVKADWLAAWRNWLRKAEEFNGPLKRNATRPESTEIYKDGDKW